MEGDTPVESSFFGNNQRADREDRHSVKVLHASTSSQPRKNLVKH